MCVENGSPWRFSSFLFSSLVYFVPVLLLSSQRRDFVRKLKLTVVGKMRAAKATASPGGGGSYIGTLRLCVCIRLGYVNETKAVWLQWMPFYSHGYRMKIFIVVNEKFRLMIIFALICKLILKKNQRKLRTLKNWKCCHLEFPVSRRLSHTKIIKIKVQFHGTHNRWFLK